MISRDDIDAMTPEHPSVKDAPARSLIKELMDRGVLRGYTALKYVSGDMLSSSRLGELEIEAVIKSEMAVALGRAAMARGLIAMAMLDADTLGPARPGDRVYEAVLLTLNPEAELEDR